MFISRCLKPLVTKQNRGRTRRRSTRDSMRCSQVRVRISVTDKDRALTRCHESHTPVESRSARPTRRDTHARLESLLKARPCAAIASSGVSALRWAADPPRPAPPGCEWAREAAPPRRRLPFTPASRLLGIGPASSFPPLAEEPRGEQRHLVRRRRRCVSARRLVPTHPPALAAAGHAGAPAGCPMTCSSIHARK